MSVINWHNFSLFSYTLDEYSFNCCNWCYFPTYDVTIVRKVIATRTEINTLSLIYEIVCLKSKSQPFSWNKLSRSSKYLPKNTTRWFYINILFPNPLPIWKNNALLSIISLTYVIKNICLHIKSLLKSVVTYYKFHDRQYAQPKRILVYYETKLSNMF